MSPTASQSESAPTYSAKQYEPLNHEEEEIRLLQMDLEDGSHELKSNISLRGDQRIRKYISIDGEQFPVSINLYQALRGVIRYWKKTYASSGKPLLLWCDQICINQSNNAEKNHQVAFMRMIYDRAEEVLVWLPLIPAPPIHGSGQSDPAVEIQNDNRTAVESLRGKFRDWAEWRNWHERVLNFGGSVDEYYADLAPMAYGITHDKASSNTTSTEIQTKEVERAMKAWSNVNTILDSPWWARAWVYQEFILATRATFLIDGFSVPWQELHEFLSRSLSQVRRHIVATEDAADVVRQEGANLTAMVTEAQKTATEEERRHRDGCCNSSYEIAKDWLKSSDTALSKFGTCVKDGYASEDDLEKGFWIWGFPIVCAVGIGAVMAWGLSKAAAGLCFLSTVCCNQSQKEHVYTVQQQATELQTYEARIPPVRTHLETHHRRLTGVTRSWDLVSFVFKSKADMTPRNNSISLSKLVSHSRNTPCADPRDKVFAFLGLTNGTYSIQADYDAQNTLRKVLVNATVTIITTEGNLNILAFAKETIALTAAEEYIPSWVANLLIPQQTDSEHTRFLAGIQFPVSSKASGRKRAAYSFHPDRHGNPNRILKARGIRVDTLSRLLEDPSDKPWRRYAGMFSLEIGTRNTARVGDEVWVLLGLDVLLTLSRPSRRDPHYTIIGHAMLWDGGHPSGILQGSVVERLDQGEASAVDIEII